MANGVFPKHPIVEWELMKLLFRNGNTPMSPQEVYAELAEEFA